MIYKTLILFLFSFLFIPELHAQYINVDSLVHLPGEAHPVTLLQFDDMVEELTETSLAAGQGMLFGQYIPLGNLLANFSLPSSGKVISRYGIRSGRMHTGTDLKMARGDTVYAVFQGIVSRAKYYYGYGNMVVIDHGNNLETSYAHLSDFLVKPGEAVDKLQPIGLAGSTGRASTNHLHFEIREAGSHFNPELVFDFENETVREVVKGIQNMAELLPAKKQPVPVYNGTSPQSYVVASGDSLWKISRRFKTPVKVLCQLNDLHENSVLNIGMVLKLF